MRQTWRWFGPADEVNVDDMAQAGVEGVVSALHHVPTGEIWTKEEIAKRKEEVRYFANGRPSGLEWEVVESLPVSEDIKQQRNDWRKHIDNYKQSLTNLAREGIETICYNFMPVLDWTRTDLAYEVPTGATCMRFDIIDFAAFDLFVLKRAGAQEDFEPEIVEAAKARFRDADDEFVPRLIRNIVFGLPGSTEKIDLETLKSLLDGYSKIDASRLKQHQFDFLEDVAPFAESLGLRLCCHPDDPPVPLLGLPRIMSTQSDYAQLVKAVDVKANGITLCSGSLGARADNDLPKMMRDLGQHVHFLHLRNVKRESQSNFGSFYEDEHLTGATDMVALVTEILREEQRRKLEGRIDCQIPFRPDHGQNILDDHNRNAQPGYPAIGRLKGLAEIRGLALGLNQKY